MTSRWSPPEEIDNDEVDIEGTAFDLCAPEAEAAVDTEPATNPYLRDALSFHASFDDGPDADFSPLDSHCYKCYFCYNRLL